MGNSSNNIDHSFLDDEIDLRELASVLIAEWKIILITTVIASIASVIYALSLPNIYASKALLAPAQQLGQANSSMSGVGGLASLAGFSLSTSSSNEIEALETISSFKFFETIFLKNIFLPDLMAPDSWDQEKNVMNYDNSIYDSETGKWVRRAKFPRESKPSSQESYINYRKKIMVSTNKETGFVTISAEHHSPYVAKEWIDIIISGVNQTLREDEKQRSLVSIDYLTKQISQTSYAEVKQQLSALVQQVTEKLMLIEANEDYIYRIIDPPIAPELKSSPIRSIICIVGFLLGAIFGTLFVFAKNYLLDRK